MLSEATVQDMHVLRNIVDHVVGQDGRSFPLREVRPALPDRSPEDGFHTPPPNERRCSEAVSSSSSRSTAATRIDDLLADLSDAEVALAPLVSRKDSFDLLLEELAVEVDGPAVVTVMHGRIPDSVNLLFETNNVVKHMCLEV